VATGAAVTEFRTPDVETICCWKAGISDLGNEVIDVEAADYVSAATGNFGGKLMDDGVSTD
jgi:hypothetical protein